MKRTIPSVALILITAAIAIGLYILAEKLFSGKLNNTAAHSAFGSPGSPGAHTEFVGAASAATPAIVHVKTSLNQRVVDPFRGFAFPYQSRGSGSGVTISSDGFIATNNHVVENASGIEVIFPDKRIYQAKLIGRDPSTDLALLKVNASRLPAIQFGNSDEVQVGEWVLAIGYPFSLNSTVTAGIISAKGRSIGILEQPRRQSSYEDDDVPAGSPVESFIQTDAAINPGNSGGALVNTRGQLIGINAAIASQTGSYAGYGFAIPVNLARKILDDLKKYGEVKRGYLGVTFPSPLTEEQFFRQQGINPGSVKGVLITGVQKGSAADEAGLQSGDIIQSIDGVNLSSSAEFSERIARHRPKDKVELTVLRNGKTKTITVKLQEEVSLARQSDSRRQLEEIHEKLGASFAPLSGEFKQRYMISSGVVVTEIVKGGLFDQVGIPAGTIILMVNGRVVSSATDIDAILSSAENSRIRIDGISPDGSRFIVTFSLGA